MKEIRLDCSGFELVPPRAYKGLNHTKYPLKLIENALDISAHELFACNVRHSWGTPTCLSPLIFFPINIRKVVNGSYNIDEIQAHRIQIPFNIWIAWPILLFHHLQSFSTS